MKPIILIPARMGSTRLPGKPLAMIAGKQMILHVCERAQAANLGPVVVATDSAEILSLVRDHGFEAVMTGADHTTGSDRIFEALNLVDPNQDYDTIINVQGDLPTIDPAIIAASLRPLQNHASTDIATLAARITKESEKDNPNIVKVVGTPITDTCLRALYFTRARAPHGEGDYYHHIGLYAYRRVALEKFVALSPTPLEQREKLEQLRALESAMRIDVEIVDTVPFGVDTEEDLQQAAYLLGHK